MNVAALYIDRRGPYPKLLGAEYCWDEKRDARTYAGPWPVVAHPACGPWGSFKKVYRGAEGGSELAFYALAQVRAFGGVLEHPAFSKFWAASSLPAPNNWDVHGFTLAVNQVDWGHPCKKPTWLYVSGLRGLIPFRPPAGREPTHWIGSTRSRTSKGKRPPEIRAACKSMRIKTPPCFAAWLVELASRCATYT